jgi:hypothetical protein
MGHLLDTLFGKRKPVEQVVAENNQKVHDLKNQSAKDILRFELEVRRLHQQIKDSTAYKVAVATGRIHT